MDSRCRSPPDRAEPFSPIRVSYPFGRRWMNSSHWAALAASITSWSDAPLRPRRMFSMMVLLNRTTSWNTMEKLLSRVSGSIPLISVPPSVIFPLSISQNLAASFALVDFPPPEGPTRAVTCPCLAVNDTSFKTCFPSL